MSNYLGKQEIHIDFIDQFSRNKKTVAKKLGLICFWNKYKVFPCDTKITDISYEHVNNVLETKYEHDIKNDIIEKAENSYCDFEKIFVRISDICAGVMLECSINPFFSKEKRKTSYIYTVYYLPEKESIANELLLSFISFTKSDEKKQDLFRMICSNHNGYYLKSVKVKKSLISDLKLHYGEEFMQVNEKILKNLNNEKYHGIILLYGLPGSGKTTYIRYLIEQITEKKIIYIPPKMITSIATPEFLPFMLKNQDSILIIEDAENIIKSRANSGDTTQSVANLLNLTDGLLGDSLRMPIIATFNCELDKIDSALLRKGRLIVKHEFDKLSIENAQKLSDHLGFITTIKESMTLADIYGQARDEN